MSDVGTPVPSPADFERRATGEHPTSSLARTCSLEAELIEFDSTRWRVGYNMDQVDDYLGRVAVTLEGFEDLLITLEQTLDMPLSSPNKIRHIRGELARHRARLPRVPQPEHTEDLPQGESVQDAGLRDGPEQV